MEQNLRNSDSNNERNDRNDQNLNTSSGLRDQSQREQDGMGSGRSYDYGSDETVSTDEQRNEQTGRNSNQQNVSNPTTTAPGGSTMPNRSDSRAGTGSDLAAKQSVTGSDTDGQNR